MRDGVQYRYYYHESRCCGAMKLIGHDSKSATEWIMHNVRPELHKSIYDEVAVNCPVTKDRIPAEMLDDPIWKLGFVLERIEKFVDRNDYSVYDMGFVCIVAEDVTCEVKMRFIEIDGKKCEVSRCLECPCMAVGEGGWATRCRHPGAFSDKEDYFGEEVPDWCPLREVEG